MQIAEVVSIIVPVFLIFLTYVIICLADCNDVGISVPCLLPGFWRPPEEAVEGLTYTVFRCDVTINCIGGCVFNASCAHGVDQTSPTCGKPPALEVGVLI